MVKLKNLKVAARFCRSGYKDCPYKGYDVIIPKGTQVLEIYDNRYCPSCAPKILDQLEQEIKLCRLTLMADNLEKSETLLSGVSLLRDPNE